MKRMFGRPSGCASAVDPWPPSEAETSKTTAAAARHAAHFPLAGIVSPNPDSVLLRAYSEPPGRATRAAAAAPVTRPSRPLRDAHEQQGSGAQSDRCAHLPVGESRGAKLSTSPLTGKRESR